MKISPQLVLVVNGAGAFVPTHAITWSPGREDNFLFSNIFLAREGLKVKKKYGRKREKERMKKRKEEKEEAKKQGD